MSYLAKFQANMGHGFVSDKGKNTKSQEKVGIVHTAENSRQTGQNKSSPPLQYWQNLCY